MTAKFLKLSLALLSVQLTAFQIYGQNKNPKVDSLAMDVTYHENTLHVQARYFYNGSNNETDSIYFSLNPSFKIDKISSPGLLSHKMTLKKGRPFPFMILKFDKPLDGKPREVDFDYVIDLEKVTQIKYGWIELMVDQFWFPNATDLDNKFVSHVTVKGLPADYSLYTYHSFHENPDHSYIIDEHKPTAETTFLAGRNMTQKTSTSGSIRITFFTSNDTPDSTLASINKKMVDIITLYNASFGKLMPVNKFTIALRTFPRKLLNSQTTRDGFVITGTEFNSYGNYAHEFGHFWWSDASFLREPWLNESFANFSMMKALRKFDPQQADKSYALFKKKAELPGPVSTVGVFDPNAYDLYYSKGCSLLLELEEKIGTKKMDRFLQRRIKDKLNTNTAVLDALESPTDKETRVAFEAKLKGS
ncbi:MAG TPA: hypothetical protein VG737_03685 [Cyclobacteriaceae bacterium]|nr:hypothetical protein [Cyclobacteriaceae bacterium]